MLLRNKESHRKKHFKRKKYLPHYGIKVITIIMGEYLLELLPLKRLPVPYTNLLNLYVSQKAFEGRMVIWNSQKGGRQENHKRENIRNFDRNLLWRNVHSSRSSALYYIQTIMTSHFSRYNTTSISQGQQVQSNVNIAFPLQT